ncbi:MAG TPA: HAD-IIA family hydrolase [Ilumatobacteraceae bacterium]|nr:HAD-IIA family hydrolase [Ilumatobacteraceae bacterium]
MGGTAAPWSTVETLLCDLDGVVWLAHRPIPGSVDAIAQLRATGRRVLFVTNNSASTRAQQEHALARIGVPAVGDVVSSAMAAAWLVHPGERVLVAGGPGVVEAVADRGAAVVINDGRGDPSGFDAVVVGLHRDFDYDRLATASAAVRAGARLIGTNSDSTYPTPGGLEPGGGSILAAIATAAGVSPVVAGKPHEPMAALITGLIAGRMADPANGFSSDCVAMVGDRTDTDGLFAQRLGCRFAVVRSGVPAAADDTVRVPVDLDAPDLAAVVARIVAGSERGQ